MIGKRHLLQHAFGAVFIERRPAPVLALEGQCPLQAALEALIALLPIIGRHLPQRQQHHRGIVHVRVPFIVEFKHPPAGFDFGAVFVVPVAAEPDFPAHQPFNGVLERRMIAGQARFVQANNDDGRVPYR